MPTPSPEADRLPPVADALVETRSGLSLVWLVPLVAVVIGAWLVYQALTEKGPTINIVFDSAAGIVAGKTHIKYKEVEAGLVERVEFSNDLEQVIVTATLAKELEPYLTEDARFWVVQAELRAGRVTGLSTLLSGVYIAMEPGQEGETISRFRGLASQPVVSGDSTGRSFALRAESMGSLNVGDPVYFRQIEAGRVTGHRLDEDGGGITIDVFVQAPFSDLVHENTRFWNASGITASFSTDGFKLRTESLASLLVGGVAFSNPKNLEPARPVTEGHEFRLFDNLEQASEPDYLRKQRYVLYFDGSVRGLKRGAPVEFRGIHLGKVLDIKLEGERESLAFKIPVLIEIESDRVNVDEQSRSKSEMQDLVIMKALVAKGLRAQLRTANLLTGQLYVDLDFFPRAAAVGMEEHQGYPVLPTVPGTLDEMRGSVMRVLGRLEKLPLEEVADDLLATIRGARDLANSQELHRAVAQLSDLLTGYRSFADRLNRTVMPKLQGSLDQLVNTLARYGSFADRLNQTAMPKLQGSLDQLNQTLSSIEANYTGKESRIYSDVGRLLEELTRTSRSLRSMADYLERHPEALISGKQGVK